MSELLPGTPVSARGLRGEVVHGEPAGAQHRYRLRCSEGALRGLEFDFLHPFEAVEPAASELDPSLPELPRVAEPRFRGNVPAGATGGDRRFRGNLSGPSGGDGTDPTYTRILALLDERGVITSADAQAATGLDAAAVRPYLKRLVENGCATVKGQRRRTRYAHKDI